MIHDYTQFIEWAFMLMTTGCLGFAVKFLGMISKSINELNIQVATIIERTAQLGKKLEEHEARISILEQRRGHRG